MRPTRMLIAAALILSSVAVAAPAATPLEGSMPDLLDRAVQRGEVTRLEADVMLARVLNGGRAPSRYRGTEPWHGTTVLLDIKTRLADLTEPGDIASLVGALGGLGRDRCATSVAPTAFTKRTAHFEIEYTETFGGLTIDDYAAALEQAWQTHIDQFGWAAPPVPEGDLYLVRVDLLLEPFLYGFVAGTTNVGDNPSTSWNEGDAMASCMVLNANYGNGVFPSTPMGALTATAAHEFNHSIQFGYGALTGNDTPQDVFVEGGATWMEDEVFDDANDSWFYLWPDFTDSMGGNDDFPYSYWVVFRGITERFGASVAGGGEDVFQRFWEQVSKNQSTGLDAMRAAVAPEGVSLEQAFHDMAVAAGLMKPCGGGYTLPHCFEEAAGYVETAGRRPATNGALNAGATRTFSVRDHLATSWIAVPSTKQRTLTVTANSGKLRGSIACDTGSSITTTPFASVLTAGQSASATTPVGCLSALLVITNEEQVSTAPSRSGVDSYTASLSA